MNKPEEFIMQMRPLFGDEEKQAICNYMDEGGFLTEFKHTKRFEEMIRGYTGAKHCIVVNNGTISLTLAALAIGLKPGDDVIVPNYTMIATPNSIKLLGANPVFVDVEPNTLWIDPENLEKVISSKTKAIMLVSANGRYPTYGVQNILAVAAKHKIAVIEDAAQSLGSFYPDGLHIGRAGQIGSFSFSAPKIISTGQGGALITDDDNLATNIRKLKDFGRQSGGTDIHDSIGYNFKFTELQACIGIEQMKKLSARVKRKKEIWAEYQKGLAQISGIKLFSHDTNYTAPWFIDALADHREQLITFLKNANIGTRRMYPPINQQLAYKKPGNFPVSDNVGANGIWLPSSVQLTNEEICYITTTISRFYSTVDT